MARFGLADGTSECPVIEGEADQALRAPHAESNPTWKSPNGLNSPAKLFKTFPISVSVMASSGTSKCINSKGVELSPQ